MIKSVKIVNENDETTLSELHYGDVFKWDDSLYMKTDGIKITLEFNSCVCVDIDSGTVRTFSLNMTVKPARAVDMTITL